MQKVSISNLLETTPQVNVTLTAEMLKEFATHLIASTKKATLEEAKASQLDTYLTGEKVKAMLGICATTLWRWKRDGYLVPVRFGGADRYKLSDINRIIDQSKK